jgi:isopenicillin-N epimerase
MLNRRDALIGAAALPLAGRLSAADDEAFWTKVARDFDVMRDVIQLENGNWGMMARPVMTAYRAKLARVNREASYYSRRGMAADLLAVKAKLAAALGVSRDEIAFTRNATEAMKALVLGYNRLKPGDAVLTADLDYGSVQAMFESLKARRNVTLVQIALPEPASHQGLIDAYAAAFDANPRIKLALLTHISHRTGLVIPVREIVAMARARGIDCVIDAAHSWGQLDFQLPALGADFIALNLHKWIGAPLGVGLLYLRESRIADIDPDPADEGGDRDLVEARVHTGTVDFAAQLSASDALAYRARIGPARIEARLRQLRSRWAEPLRALPGLEILTPSDPRLHGGITSFRIGGNVTQADNVAIAKALLDDHRIFSVMRSGVAKGACIRITPGIFTRPSDIDALVSALPKIVARFARS